MLPRFLGLLPFFVLGLHLKPRHLRHLDDVWVKRRGRRAGADRHHVLACDLDDWARTALLWYDAGYEDLDVNAIVRPDPAAVMAVGLLGAFAVMALVPRRRIGWFTAMGAATMNVYLLHGFVIKTAKALG